MNKLYTWLQAATKFLAGLTGAVASQTDFKDNYTAMKEYALKQRASLWANHKCPECKGEGVVAVKENEWAICSDCLGLGIDVEWLHAEVRELEE